MERSEVKNILDQELKDVRLSHELKERLRNRAFYRKSSQTWKAFMACAAVLILGGTTVFAGYHMLNRIQVNEEVLPELDSMMIVEMNAPKGAENEFGILKKDYRDYSDLKRELGTKLLDSELSGEHPYMLCHLQTDPESYAILRIDNFILGDTRHYQYMEDVNSYSYEHGEVYFSPVSLKAELILGEEQLALGWDTDYLGMYRFVEQYVSAQGYRVNLVEDTIDVEPPEAYVSEKAAVFVADGIRYTLTGRVSCDTMKDIVDSMK
ncbi:MAG: hypothetical protein HFI29_05070 [Lachnospiraceae bacterium]|jgi:hypothetical protein|nr:hypothetical protein [Lachnospiraceae bacterium]